MGSKGSGGGQSSSKVEPWSGAQPYLKDIMSEAQKLYEQGYGTAQYPYQTVAPRAGATSDAISMIADRARAGSPLQQPLQQGMAEVLSGSRMMEGNPYFSAMAGRVRDEVQPGINATFGGLGRTGGGLHQESLAKGLGDSIGALAYQNYGDEANRQMQAFGLAPSIMQSEYDDGRNLLAAGQMDEEYTQRLIDADRQRFMFQENAPWDLLNRYAGVSGPFAGFGANQQSKQSGNLMGDIGSAAQTAASMYLLLSSRSAKEIGPEADGEEVLRGVRGLEVGRWKYREDAVPEDQSPHIGPYAEDFAETFGVGDGRHISMIDAIGVLFASVKALTDKVDRLTAELEAR